MIEKLSFCQSKREISAILRNLLQISIKLKNRGSVKSLLIVFKTLNKIVDNKYLVHHELSFHIEWKLDPHFA